MKNGYLHRLGQWVVRHRWGVIIFWGLLLVAGAYFSPKLDNVLQGGNHLSETEAGMVGKILKNDFGNRFSYVLVLVFSSPTRQADDAAFREAVEAVQTGLRDSSKVNSIVTYYDTDSSDLISKDRRSVLGVVELDVAGDSAAQDAAPEIRKIVAQAGVPGWLKVHVTGDPAACYDVTQVSARDLVKAEKRAFPVAILVLIFTFGALLAAGIPVVLGAVAVAISLGIVYFVAQQIPMVVLAKNAASMIGLGVGIDYSLFMVSRFREELRRGLSPREAAVAIMSTAGRTVLFSGSTVVVGILGILGGAGHP